MAQVTTKPSPGGAEYKILGKKIYIPVQISTVLKFKHPVEVTAQSWGAQKRTAIDEVFVIIKWQKKRKLVVQSSEAGLIVKFTDPELDKIYKQKMAFIEEEDLSTAMDAYNEFLLVLSEY